MENIVLVLSNTCYTLKTYNSHFKWLIRPWQSLMLLRWCILHYNVSQSYSCSIILLLNRNFHFKSNLGNQSCCCGCAFWPVGNFNRFIKRWISISRIYFDLSFNLLPKLGSLGHWTLVYIGPATLKGLQLKKRKIVPSKSSATGPKKAWKCVRTFSHHFFDLFASRDAVGISFFCRNSRYGRKCSLEPPF